MRAGQSRGIPPGQSGVQRVPQVRVAARPPVRAGSSGCPGSESRQAPGQRRVEWLPRVRVAARPRSGAGRAVAPGQSRVGQVPRVRVAAFPRSGPGHANTVRDSILSALCSTQRPTAFRQTYPAKNARYSGPPSRPAPGPQRRTVRERVPWLHSWQHPWQFL